MLPAAGCERAELYADDEMRAPIVFHNLRDTCLTHMAVRGDDPLRIQWRGGHTDFKTTQGYIAQGRNLAPAFGQAFPPLPPGLLGPSWSPNQSPKLTPAPGKYPKPLSFHRDPNGN